MNNPNVALSDLERMVAGAILPLKRTQQRELVKKVDQLVRELEQHFDGHCSRGSIHTYLGRYVSNLKAVMGLGTTNGRGPMWHHDEALSALWAIDHIRRRDAALGAAEPV